MSLYTLLQLEKEILKGLMFENLQNLKKKEGWYTGVRIDSKKQNKQNKKQPMTPCGKMGENHSSPPNGIVLF